MNKLEHALALAAQGFKVFPIKPGAKAPPLLNDWPNKATSDPDTVRLYWLPVPDANIGIHCGGMVVLDVDVKKGGHESLKTLDVLPATRRAITPSGGQHIFYRLPDGVGGVRNTVEELGKGLDTRSAHGYVVAAGSTVAAGEYAWENDAPIADAPRWLVERLSRRPATESPSEDRSPPPDAPDEVVERAKQWLAGQLPAIEGCGGDARTFAVAAGLRDMGVSRAQALALLHLWNVTCAPPWAPEELEAKVANAYKYAENAPGIKAALPQDFPIVPNLGTKVPKKGTSLLSLAQFAALESRGPGYLAKGLLQRRSYASIYGAPGEGKTFVALDIAYHVAAGKPWHDRKVHAGPVLYLAYEGTGGLVSRAKALRQKYGEKDVPLYIVSAAYDLREKTGRAELGDVISAVAEKPVLIVIDTFARALMGGDENSAQDVGAFNGAVASLIEATGACVAIIHHSGKDKSRGARGSSALLGALDTEIEIDSGSLNCKKQRDIEITAPIGFKLVPVVVGIDEDGDPATSCVVEPAQVQTGRLAPLKGNALNGFEVLCRMSPNNEPVPLARWREACKEFLGDKRTAGTFFNIKSKLLKTGHIVADEGGLVTRRMT